MICTKMDSRHFVSTISNYHRLFQPHRVETTFLCFPSKHEDSLLLKKNAFPSTLCFVRHQRINVHNTRILRADPRRASQIYIAYTPGLLPRPLYKFVQNTISLHVPMQLYCKRVVKVFFLSHLKQPNNHTEPAPSSNITGLHFKSRSCNPLATSVLNHLTR